MEQDLQAVRCMRFGAYEADLDTGELRKSGRRINLQEQPFQVLALLLHHAGRLITREDLQKHLWPEDTFVDFDLGLNTAIKKIRAALGDSADHPKFIETLPRKGYRFIYPVERVVAPVPAPAVVQNHTAVIDQKVDYKSLVQEPRFRIWVTMGALLLVLLLAGFGFDRLLRRGNSHGVAQPLPSMDVLRQEAQGTPIPAAYQAYLKGRDFMQAYDMPEGLDHAIEAFRRALEADSSYGLAYAALGQACWRKFKATKENQWYKQAQDACNRALELDSERADAHVCQGVIHNGVGEYQQAMGDFSTAIQADPKNADAYRGRAWAHLQLNRTAQAEADYLQAIQSDPYDWHGYSSLANLYLGESRYDEAAQKYKQAIAIKPDNSELRFSLAAAYIDAGRYDHAVAVLDEAVKLRPTFGAYENAGTLLLNGRRFSEAIRDFKKAVDLEPGNYLLYGNLARAYFFADQKVLARENYIQAITIAGQQLAVNANDPDANLSLAIYHAMLGQRNDALFYLDRSLQLRPDAGEPAFWAGVVHLQLGDRAKALVWLRKARALKYSVAEINAAPELESLHGDAEFQQLMAKAPKPVTAN